MKAVEILSETPYVHDGDYKAPEGMEKETFISDRSLAREQKHLGFEVFDAMRVDFYLMDLIKVIGVVKKKKEKTQEMSNLIVFSLRFKQTKTIVNYPEGINRNDVLQVDSVYVSRALKGRGIASFVYSMLVEQGFIVVSDTSQFSDGKELWKKISREAKFNDYVIHIIDDEKDLSRINPVRSLHMTHQTLMTRRSGHQV